MKKATVNVDIIAIILLAIATFLSSSQSYAQYYNGPMSKSLPGDAIHGIKVVHYQESPQVATIDVYYSYNSQHGTDIWCGAIPLWNGQYAPGWHPETRLFTNKLLHRAGKTRHALQWDFSYNFDGVEILLYSGKGGGPFIRWQYKMQFQGLGGDKGDSGWSEPPTSPEVIFIPIQ